MTDWQIEGLKTIEKAMAYINETRQNIAPLTIYGEVLAQSIRDGFEEDAAYIAGKIDKILKESKS